MTCHVFTNKLNIDDFPEKYENFLYDLNEYYISPRYPDISYSKPYPKSDRERAGKYLRQTREIYLWLKKSVSQKR